MRATSLAENEATPYRISLTRTGDGAGGQWLAEVDGMPACSGRGSTPEEAVQRAWAAVDERSPAPVDHASPAPTEAVTPRHSGRLLVRMPATLHDELARAAEAEGVSLNQLITGVLAGAVEWRGAGESSHARHATVGDTDEMPLPARLTRAVLAVNLVVVLLAAVAAVALLVIAWRAGL